MPADQPSDFDAWRPSDLLRFLRAYGSLSDRQDSVCTTDVQAVLGIDDAAALAAHHRVVALDLLEEVPDAPHRLSDGVLDFQARLTRDGVRAVLSDRIPGLS